VENNPFEFPPELFSKVPLFAEIAKAMSWTGGPVNWDIARQIATAMATAEHVAPVIDDDRAELADAARLAEAWLVESAGLPPAPGVARVLALTPTQWADRALGLYPELLNPLGGKLAGAMAQHAPENAEGESPLAGVVSQLLPLLLGIQCGSVLGTAARYHLTGYDVALPLEEDGVVPILLPHVDAHARSYDLDRRDVRYWVALHASAHRMLYEALPWTRTHFWSLYHGYLAAVDVNLGEMIERLQAIDISNPEQIESAVGENMFGIGEPGFTGPAAERLHQFLALLEAAAGKAVEAAAGGKLVSGPSIVESFTRRRAEEPGFGALQRFAGLEPSPEIERGAAAFCDAVLDAGGWRMLNRLWEDPEHLPSAGEFADPQGWLRRVA
jgi:putative hydrolase